MDNEKKIKILTSENEFLQLQLEDINVEIKRRDEEITLLEDASETKAVLRSKIDNNLFEIEQLKFNNLQVSEKTQAIEMLNEELELNLYKEIKERRHEQKTLKDLNAVKVNMQIISEELNEAATLYREIQDLKAELAEAKSIENITALENKNLRKQVEALNENIRLLQLKKQL